MYVHDAFLVISLACVVGVYLKAARKESRRQRVYKALRNIRGA